MTTPSSELVRRLTSAIHNVEVGHPFPDGTRQTLADALCDGLNWTPNDDSAADVYEAIQSLARTAAALLSSQDKMREALTADEQQIGVIRGTPSEHCADPRMSVKQWNEPGESPRITFGLFIGDHKWIEQEFEPEQALKIAALIYSKPAISTLRSQQSSEVERLQDEMHGAIVAAYIAGATDVHNNWQEDRDPDFTEAAHDYASTALARSQENGE